MKVKVLLPRDGVTAYPHAFGVASKGVKLGIKGKKNPHRENALRFPLTFGRVPTTERKAGPREWGTKHLEQGRDNTYQRYCLGEYHSAGITPLKAN